METPDEIKTERIGSIIDCFSVFPRSVTEYVTLPWSSLLKFLFERKIIIPSHSPCISTYCNNIPMPGICFYFYFYYFFFKFHFLFICVLIILFQS